METRCHWCQQKRNGGEMRYGYWVCYVCFPEEKGEGRLKEPKKCGQCHKKKYVGGEIMGQFLCGDCCPMFGSGGGNNKYAKQGGKRPKKSKKKAHYVQPELHEPKQKKPKKKDKWKVHIIEVLSGSLWEDLAGDCTKSPANVAPSEPASFIMENDRMVFINQ